MTNTLDVDGLIKKGELTLSPEEHPDERTSRLRNDDRKKLIDDVKGVVLFAAMLLAIIGIGGMCAFLIWPATNASADAQRWAETILSSLLTGSIAFLVGRAMPKE